MKNLKLIGLLVGMSCGAAVNAAAPRSGAWTQDNSGSVPVWNATAGAINIEASPSVYSGSTDGATWNRFSTGTMGCQDSAYSDNQVAGDQPSLQMYYTYDDSETITFNFSEYVTNPVMHFDRVGGGGGASGTTTAVEFTLLTPGITLTELAERDVHFETTPTTVTRSVVTYTATPSECGTEFNGTAAGSVQLMGTFNTITFQADLNGTATGAARDLFEISFTDVVAAEVDYGDAPNSYGDAGHLIVSSPALRLGSVAPDGDTPGNGNNQANSDDNTGIDDENGIVTPNFARGTPYDVTVNVTTAGVGYLNVWLDWNRDGDFDSNERISLDDQAVTTGAISLTGIVPANASTGLSYVRARICSTQGDCNSPSGLAQDGEAEDRRRRINADPQSGDISVTKSDAGSSYTPGSQIEYTLTIANDGPSSASGINITDSLPNGMTLRDGGAGFGWVCAVTTAGTGSTPTACPITNGPSSGSLVDLNVDMANDAVITVTVYAQFSADPSDY